MLVPNTAAQENNKNKNRGGIRAAVVRRHCFTLPSEASDRTAFRRSHYAQTNSGHCITSIVAAIDRGCRDHMTTIAAASDRGGLET